MKATLLNNAVFADLYTVTEAYAELRHIGSEAVDAARSQGVLDMQAAYDGKDIEITNDVSYCQGSGSSFTGTLNALEIIPELDNPERFGPLTDACVYEQWNVIWTRNSRYAHECSTELALADDVFEHDEYPEAFWEAFGELEDALKEWAIAKNRALHKAATRAYEVTWNAGRLGVYLVRNGLWGDFIEELEGSTLFGGMDDDEADEHAQKAFDVLAQAPTVDIPEGYGATVYTDFDGRGYVLAEDHEAETKRNSHLLEMWELAA